MEDEQEVIIWDGFRYYTGMTDKSYKINLATGATFAITDDELIAHKKTTGSLSSAIHSWQSRITANGR